MTIARAENVGQKVDANAPTALAAAIILGTVGVLSFIIQPGLVQGFVTELGRSESEAVNLASIEMLGTAAAAIFLAFFSGYLSWRKVAFGGLLLAAAGNIFSALLIDGDQLVFARLMAGLGHGAIISISFTLVGITRRAERNLALYLVLLLTYGAFMLWYLPSFFAVFGIQALFYMFAAICFASLLTVGLIPSRYNGEIAAALDARDLGAKMVALALAGVLAYNLAIGIAWGILALIGLDAGFSEQAVADALFLSQLFAIVGALASVYLADKIGSHLAIGIGILAGAASVGLLVGKPGYAVYSLAVCAFNLLWNFALPFILAKVCAFETRGRMMSYAIALQMIGLAVGPLIAGFLIGDGDYTAPQLLCIAMFIASYVLLLPPMRRHRALTRPSQTVSA